MNDQNHKRIKTILKIVGISMLVVGAVFTIIAFINFFSSFGSYEPPTLFWCCFIGLPLLGFGGMITMFAFNGEIARYLKNESVPVANEAADELRPAVKSVVSTVVDAAKEGIDSGVLCECGTKNDEGSKFCKNCGKKLTDVCPTCGNATDSGKFCNHCGNPL